jgi:hypothetical protein
MPNPSFYPGRRLSISSNLCTIRYLGTVDGSKGDWLGVEWDEPDKGRGKHSGDHDGVRYFTCNITTLFSSQIGQLTIFSGLNPHPKAASFIRPSRPIEQPLTFLQALRKKYAFDETADPAAPDTTIEISGKVVEEVGFDKVRKQLATLQDLRIILLDGLCIAGIQARPWPADLGAEQWRKELAEITATCPKVTELDLSRNLLECLVDVAGICKALPQLKSLKLKSVIPTPVYVPPSGVNTWTVVLAFMILAPPSCPNTMQRIAFAASLSLVLMKHTSLGSRSVSRLIPTQNH